MKTYTLICGVYGVGKSTFSGALTYILGSDIKIVNHDQSVAREYIKSGISFIHETTLADDTAYQDALLAKGLGYSVNMIYIALCSAEESQRRVINRVERGGHDIEKKYIFERFDMRFKYAAKILPICERAMFFDNENGFVPVAAYEKGELELLTSAEPAWFCELTDILKKEKVISNEQ